MRIYFFFLFLTVANAQDKWIPHIPDKNGGFETIIIISNVTDQAQQYLFEPYYANGSKMPMEVGFLDAKTSITFTAEDLFFSPSPDENISHFYMTSSSAERVDVQVVYTKPGGGFETNVGLYDPSKVWRVVSGDWEFGWDGLAIVNTHYKDQNITIRGYNLNGDGGVAFTHQIFLERRAKHLLMLNELEMASSNQAFEIAADEKIVVLGLRGDGNVLSTNVTVPLVDHSVPEGARWFYVVNYMRGHWFFSYYDNQDILRQAVYHLSDIVYQDNKNLPPVIHGTDSAGNYDVVGSYYPGLAKFAILDSGESMDKLFVFDLGFHSVNGLDSCYYEVIPPGSKNLSKCYSLEGHKKSSSPNSGEVAYGDAIQKSAFQDPEEKFYSQDDIVDMYQQLRGKTQVSKE